MRFAYRCEISKIGLVATFVAVAMIAAGCQTYGPDNVNSVHLGMDKSLVVETLGSPTYVRRIKMRDKWIYEYMDKSGNVTVREVHFESGRAVYIGPPVPPAVSAEEQDRINAQQLNEDDKADRAEKEARDRRLGIERAHAKGESIEQNDAKNEDVLDRKLRESYYGVDPDQKDLRNTVAPVYTPIK